MSWTSLAYFRFPYSENQQEKRKSAGQVLPYYRFAFANEQEAEIGWKSENQQDKSCLLPFCVRKWARSGNQQEERKSAGEVLPITVLRSQMSKRRKSAGQVLPITVLRSSRKTVISNTDMCFRKRRIWESMFVSISSIKSKKRRGARSVPCGTRFLL